MRFFFLYATVNASYTLNIRMRGVLEAVMGENFHEVFGGKRWQTLEKKTMPEIKE